jgi:hypothetical protein
LAGLQQERVELRRHQAGECKLVLHQLAGVCLHVLLCLTGLQLWLPPLWGDMYT